MEIEIDEDLANQAVRSLLREAAVLLGLEKTGDRAVEYITDPHTWTTEPTPALARRAADSSVSAVYQTALSGAKEAQGYATAIQQHLIEQGRNLEADNVELLQRVDAKLAEIDATSRTGAAFGLGPGTPEAGTGGDGGAGRRRLGGRPFLDRGAL